MPRPTQALVDLDAIRHNFSVISSLAPGSQVFAVVKADAYGHGMIPVARALSGLAPAFATACVDEALELRKAGLHEPVLLLQGFYESEELTEASVQGFWPVIENEQQLRLLTHTPLPKPLQVWIKIDSGMHRLGFAPSQAAAVFQTLQQTPNVHATPGWLTHFSNADASERSTTLRQIKLFDAHLNGLPGPRSLCNSPGLLQWPEAHADWVRPGFLLYGSSPLSPPASALGVDLRPAMTLISSVMSVRTVARGEHVGYGGRWQARRDSRIATVAVGYADGYPRHANDGTPVLIRGQRAPLAGRVSMDMITVDVTDIPDVGIGDPAILWGAGLDVSDVARHAGTIGYALLAAMPARPRRIYQSSRSL